MKYFKHETDATFNKKVKLLKRKFKAEGYGIYFQIIELIAHEIDKDNFTEWGFLPKEYEDFDFLSEEVATELATLKDVIEYCFVIGLFEKRNERLYCERVIQQADEYTQKLIKQMNDKGKEVSRDSRDSVVSKSGIRKEEEEKRKEEEEKKPEKLFHSLKYLDELPQEDVDKWIKEREVSERQVKEKARAFRNYCESHGRVYKNYRAALDNAICKDFAERKLRTSLVIDDLPDLSEEQRLANVKRIEEMKAKVLGGRHV